MLRQTFLGNWQAYLLANHGLYGEAEIRLMYLADLIYPFCKGEEVLSENTYFVEWQVWYRNTLTGRQLGKSTHRRFYVEMRRPEKIAADKSVKGGFSDEKFVRDFPTLTEYLTDDKWEDGKPRELSKIQLFVQDAGICACLSDVALERGLYVVAATVQDALKALEKHAKDPNADWRRWSTKKRK